VFYTDVMTVYCSSHNGHVNTLSEHSAVLPVLNLSVRVMVKLTSDFYKRISRLNV
jgi:hypothetical protein